MQHSLKLGGTNYHFKWGKIPGTAPYWKAWLYMYHAALSNIAPYLKKWIKRSKLCKVVIHTYTNITKVKLKCWQMKDDAVYDTFILKKDIYHDITSLSRCRCSPV
jgi:hypothetical protein